jgi:glycosyltransferase involved in cell wall biosynthesis
VVEGTNGYIIEDPLNADEIKDRIERALQLTRDSVIEHNHEYLKPFSWQNHVRQLLEVYTDVTEKKYQNG